VYCPSVEERSRPTPHIAGRRGVATIDVAVTAVPAITEYANDGKVVNISALAREHGVDRKTIKRRLAAGTLQVSAPAEPAVIGEQNQEVPTPA
jgi:hypothetical protein